MPHLRHKHKHASKGNAKRQAKANKDAAEGSKGGGTIVIDGNARARSQAIVAVVDARAGIDGPYLIEEVEHTVLRNAGWTSHLTVKLPGKGTGQDGRKA